MKPRVFAIFAFLTATLPRLLDASKEPQGGMPGDPTAAGLLPLAYGVGGYDLYMAPMALTLGYGLVPATPLTLLLVPSLYLIGADLRQPARRQRSGGAVTTCRAAAP